MLYYTCERDYFSSLQLQLDPGGVEGVLTALRNSTPPLAEVGCNFFKTLPHSSKF